MNKKTKFISLVLMALLTFSLFGQKSSYKLSALDVLRVEVFQEPDLEKMVKISAQGNVVLPLLGSVHVEGLTVVDAIRKIENLYEKDYLVDPHVNVFVMEYAPKRVRVFGQVFRQGEVIFPPEEGITLTKAIGDAGGFTGKANRNSVIVKRIMPDGTQKTFDIDVQAILGNQNVRDMPLEDGDTVQVKEDIF